MNALLDMSIAEAIERLAHGETQAVLDAISDPMDRLRAQGQLRIFMADPEERAEELQTATHEGAAGERGKLIAAFTAIDRDLGAAIEIHLEDDDVADLTAELRRAIDEYVIAELTAMLEQRQNDRQREAEKAELAAKAKKPKPGETAVAVLDASRTARSRVRR